MNSKEFNLAMWGANTGFNVSAIMTSAATGNTAALVFHGALLVLSVFFLTNTIRRANQNTQAKG